MVVEQHGEVVMPPHEGRKGRDEEFRELLYLNFLQGGVTWGLGLGEDLRFRLLGKAEH